MNIADGEVEGQPVVVADVRECAPSSKPCKTSRGRAYLRAHDVDYELSALEEQALLAQREAPHFDRRPVAGTSVADLDADLAALWRRSVRQRSPGHGLARFDDDAMLLHGGIVDTSGQLTIAGLLGLGLYPQRWFPQHVVRAAVEPRADDPAEIRARDVRVFDGPIPRMLDGALDWAAQVMESSVETAADGRVFDRYEYPLDAVREIVANALVHRDLDAWSEGMAIEIRLLEDRIVVSNPGGLYGITADRLGKGRVTMARNGALVGLCQNIRGSDSGARVIEALATGIPTVLRALQTARMPPPIFQDQGIRFTAIMRQNIALGGTLPALTGSFTIQGPAANPTQLNESERRVVEAVRAGAETVRALGRDLGMKANTIGRILRSLRSKGLVIQHGGPGRPTTYAIADPDS